MQHLRFPVLVMLGFGGVGCEGFPPPDGSAGETVVPRTATVERALGHCGEPLCFLAPDTLLNSTVSGAQEMPAVATAPDGATVVVFRDRSGAVADPTNGDAIRARFFDPQGQPLGEDVRVETDTARTQTTPGVAVSTGGIVLVVWADNRLVAPDVAGYAVRGRRFLADGTPLDEADFVVNLGTSGDQQQPAVAATPDGGFLIAWRDTGRRAPDTSSGAIRARRLGADGALSATEVLVNSTTAGDQSEPALAVAPDGRWAVAFTDGSLGDGDAGGTQVRLRFFGADDLPTGPDVRVNDRTDGDQRQAKVSFAPDGTLLVVFTDRQLAGAPTGYDVLGRTFDASGVAIGPAFEVATTRDRAQSAPVVGALDTAGRWLVAFTDDSRTAPDVSNSGIRGRLLRFDGAFDGDDQVLATATYGTQAAVALPARSGRHLLVAWADSGNVPPDLAAPAIRGRRAVFAFCGDGRVDVEEGEACDDGNTAPGDGCSAECIREPPTFEACALHCRPTAGYDRCNGADDDCDGLVDEDGDKGFDPAHCGGCDQGPCAPATPYAVRLLAPAGSALWEPSGAAVAGDRLWVANDKDGVLAAYALPLVDGANPPVTSMAVRPNGVTPKWEALRLEPAGTMLLHNATGNTLWRCDPAIACVGPVSVGIAPQLAALGAGTRIESLSPVGDRLWLGTRATPSRVADEAGIAVSLGSLSPDGRAYQMSDARSHGGRFYSLWSYEGGGSAVNDVAGLLAVSAVDGAGRPDPATSRICLSLRGKPEGFDVWGEDFIVVFDQDDARKAKGAADPNRFSLLSTEDFATRVPIGACD
jgi:cysteine-rich repeat protein